jgi:histone demethylase
MSLQADEGDDNIEMDDVKTEVGSLTVAASSTTTAKDSKDSKADIKVNTLDIPTKIETVKSGRRKLRVDISMKAIDVLEACQAYAASTGPAGIKISCSILPDDMPPPQPPERPKVKLSREQLLPPTPSVYLENKKDAFSPQLQVTRLFMPNLCL